MEKKLGRQANRGGSRPALTGEVPLSTEDTPRKSSGIGGVLLRGIEGKKMLKYGQGGETLGMVKRLGIWGEENDRFHPSTGHVKTYMRPACSRARQ